MLFRDLKDNLILLFANITARYRKMGNIRLELYGIKRTSTMQAVERGIFLLPEELKEKPVTIQVLKEKYYTIIRGNKSTGAFIMDQDEKFTGRIMIKGDSIHTGWDSIKKTVLHEYGHYLDYLYGWTLSDNTEFIQITKKEESRYRNEQKRNNLRDPKEYFAESFADYLILASKLKEEAPETYQYMKQIIDDIHLPEAA